MIDRLKRTFLVTIVAMGSLVPASSQAVTGEPPLPGPVLSYDAHGFAARWRDTTIAIARQGTRHLDDPTGRIALYTFVGDEAQWPPAVLVDTELDDRNAAGGVSRSGALVVFYSRYDAVADRWIDLRARRISRNGEVSEVAIPTGDDEAFSAYGGLVVLPSGRLMQTVYGWGWPGGRFTMRVRALFSDDDGRTWTQESMILGSGPIRATETAAAFVWGQSDAQARLIAVSRGSRYLSGDRWESGLFQSESTDGGKTWRYVGAISTGVRDVVPWIANISGSRMAIAVARRDDDEMSISVRVGKNGEVFGRPDKWPAPRIIHRSALQGSRPASVNGMGMYASYGDFGYPSIVRTGAGDAGLSVVFYDTPSGSSGVRSHNVPSDTDLLLRPLF